MYTLNYLIFYIFFSFLSFVFGWLIVIQLKIKENKIWWAFIISWAGWIFLWVLGQIIYGKLFFSYEGGNEIYIAIVSTILIPIHHVLALIGLIMIVVNKRKNSI